MFPYAKHLPALCFQQSVHLPIPGFVALNLGFPEGGAGPRPGGVLGAAVPETTIHKYRGLALELMVRQLFRSGESNPNRSRIQGLVWGVDY